MVSTKTVSTSGERRSTLPAAAGLPTMAAIETRSDEDADGLAAAAAVVGPLRNPDACVLACPDCTCRRLLEQGRGCESGESSSPQPPTCSQ
jgi:hypothetical protein